MYDFQYQQLMDRLIRIETRQVKVMQQLGIDPYSGMPQHKDKNESRRDTSGRDTLQGHDNSTMGGNGNRSKP